MMMIVRLLLLSLSVTAFHIPATTSGRQQASVLYNSIIKSEQTDFDVDVGQGGVRLAEESVLVMTGSYKNKKGLDVADLLRYDQLTSIEKSDCETAVLGTGQGILVFYDPGTGTESKVTYAPVEAAEKALASFKEDSKPSKICVNFCGGKDLYVLEVTRAVQAVAEELKVDLEFYSLSDETFPDGQASCTLVQVAAEEAAGEDEAPKLSGAKKAIAEGKVFVFDGEYYTVTEEDLNTAVA